ncbi:hypothetical protein PKHYL_24610 [Psychrobacter sp. KH172YL61]|nr:hypothetical protein PKHYL_24610 [Psychrobacter sp. KH172YL61]
MGFENGRENILRVAKRAEQAGIAAIAIHGRTREDMYTGEARYELIREVKDSISIPVIANGDIDSAQKAQHVYEMTGCDAVMIGRAAQGQPWIFRDIERFLRTGDVLDAPSVSEIKEVVLAHLQELYDFYGEVLWLPYRPQAYCVVYDRHPQLQRFPSSDVWRGEYSRAVPRG